MTLARRRDLFLALGVLVASATIRIGFIEWRGVDSIVPQDSTEYLLLARNLHHAGTLSLDVSQPYRPTTRRPPGYPFFLCLLSVLGMQSLGAVAAAQALLGGIVAILVYGLARLAVSPTWALGAALFYAIHPGAIAATATILSEPLFTTLLVGAVLATSFAWASGGQASSVLAGVLFGAAALTRSAALVVPIVLALAAWCGVPVLRPRTRHGWLLVGSTLIMVAPWVLRSSLLAGAVVPIQSGSGAPSFYVASRFDWSQTDQMVVWAHLRDDLTCGRPQGPSFGASLSPRELWEADRLCVSAAVRNIRAHPWRFVYARAKAMPYLFLNSYDTFTGFDTSFATAVHGGHWWKVLFKGALLFVFSLVPAALALVSLRQLRRDIATAACLITCACTLVVQAPIFIEPRFWLPVVPLEIVAAASGARVIMQWSRGRRLEVGLHPGGRKISVGGPG